MSGICLRLLGSLTDFSPMQPLKALRPIVATLSGIFTEVMWTHPSRALSSIDAVPSRMLTLPDIPLGARMSALCLLSYSRPSTALYQRLPGSTWYAFNDTHIENAPSPMLETVDGMKTSVSDWHPSNAHFSIVRRSSWKDADLIEAQPEKALLPTIFTEPGM